MGKNSDILKGREHCNLIFTSTMTKPSYRNDKVALYLGMHAYNWRNQPCTIVWPHSLFANKPNNDQTRSNSKI